jgi:hypothetical protein
MTRPSDAESAGQIELKVNGREVPLGGFAGCFIIETICGMLGALHGVEEIHTVNLVITKEPDPGESG